MKASLANASLIRPDLGTKPVRRSLTRRVHSSVVFAGINNHFESTSHSPSSPVIPGEGTWQLSLSEPSAAEERDADEAGRLTQPQHTTHLVVSRSHLWDAEAFVKMIS